MIKELRDITEKDLAYMQTHQVTVTEKLDLIYFKVILNDTGVTTVTAKNKPITEIDQIVNSVYKNIISFVDRHIKSNYDSIYNSIGNCEIGFFYRPVPRTCVIEYNNIDHDFIIGNLFTSVKNNNDIDKLASLIGDVSVLKPICIKERICDIPDHYDSINIVYEMTDGKTWSGNSIYEIEGIILTCGKLHYKVTVNHTEPNIEKTTKKLYRDTLLENFCNVILDKNNTNTDYVLDGDSTYVEKIGLLFLDYINRTNIFTKMYIEPEDLLPPNVGYIGDIDYDAFTPTVKLICKGNELYKNILRILLITFNRSVFENKFKCFNDDVRSKLTQILTRINTKK
jgi:hypothetical protein